MKRRQSAWRVARLCLLLMCVVTAKAEVSSSVNVSFSAIIEVANLQHIRFIAGRQRLFTGLLVDREVQNGNVYVAGVNELLQFDANLDPVRTISQLVGPLRDSHCRVSSATWVVTESSDSYPGENTTLCTLSKRPYDTYVKNMQMYPRDSRNRDGRVLVCFNAYTGLCEMRNGTNVSRSAFGTKYARPPCVGARRLNLTDMFVFGRSAGEKEMSMFHARSYAPTGGLREQSAAVTIAEVEDLEQTEDGVGLDPAGNVLNVPESRSWCPGQHYLLTRRMYDFTLSSNRATAVSVIVASQFRTDFYLDYRYAFKWATRHAYFVTVQKSLIQTGVDDSASGAWDASKVLLRRNNVPLSARPVRYEIRLTRACFEEQALLNSYLDVGLRCATSDDARAGERASDWPDYAVAAQLVTTADMSTVDCQTSQCGDTTDAGLDKLGEESYLLVLAKSSNSSHTGRQSAMRLCVFRMSRIVAAFADTVNQCAAPAATRAPSSTTASMDSNTQVSYADGSTGCNASQPSLVGSGNSWCAFRASSEKPNDHLAGVRSTRPLFSDSVIRLTPGVEYTTLIARYEQPVGRGVYSAFVGDARGRLTKLSLALNQSAVNAGVDGAPTFQLAQEPIVSLSFDYGERSIFALTSTRIAKLAVSNLTGCRTHKTCESCVTSGDASCGWCVADATCSTKTQCTDSAEQLNLESTIVYFFYVPFQNRTDVTSSINTCPSISSIKLARTPSDTYNLQSALQLMTLHFDLRSIIAQPPVNWNCLFEWNFPNGTRAVCATALHSETAQCPLPAQLSGISVLPNTVLRINVSISNLNGLPVTRPRTIIGYDCSALTTCRSCVENSPNDTCAWYVESHSCFPIHLPNPVIASSNLALQHDQTAIIGASRVPTIDMPSNKLKEAGQRVFQVDGASSCPNVRGDPSRPYAAGQNETVTLLANNFRAYMNVSIRCIFVFGDARERAARLVDSTHSADFSTELLQTTLCSGSPKCPKVLVTDGYLINSSAVTQLHCGSVRFRPIDTLSDTVSVYVVWNGSSRLDAAGRVDARIELETYRCGLPPNASEYVNADGTRWMGTCTECVLRSPARYGCTYCVKKQACTLRRECPASSAVASSAAQCPLPSVHSVSPANTTLLGGTLVEILGTDLGAAPSDVLRVELAGVPCVSRTAEYVTARRIVCEASASAVPRTGPVLITVRRDTTSVNSSLLDGALFNYVDVRVTSISRRRALRSGGALLEITGEQLNAGLQRDVRIRLDVADTNGNVPPTVDCSLVAANATQLMCVTKASLRAAPGQLEVLIDGRVVSRRDAFPFDIVDKPRNIRLGYSRTILIGGVELEVTGDDLDVVSTAQIQLFNVSDRFIGTCEVQNATQMLCVTPTIEKQSRNLTVPMLVNVSFLFDEVLVENVAAITVYNNPDFQPVSRIIDDVFEVGSTKLEYLTLDAKNPDGFGALRQSDIQILVGKHPCNITTLTARQITCLLPIMAIREANERTIINTVASDKPQADAVDERSTNTRKRRDSESEVRASTSLGANVTLPNEDESTGAYIIEVRIGRLPVFVIGKVRIGRPAPAVVDAAQEPYGNVLLVVGCLSGALLVVVFIVIAIIVACMRCPNKRNRHAASDQDVLALRDTQVARIAKQTYFELQTAGGGDADENVQLGPGVPIPFLDYRAYCMHFMFPSDPYTHPVVRPLQLPDDLDARRREQIERGVKQFNLLLSNKHFVLLFVRTIEQEITRMPARVHFASLLSACLHSRLDHFTDVLKTLLADLIKRLLSAQSGIPNHARLLLRQTESVAEKMLTVWFAFMLYKYIRCTVGEPLYQLYYAIMQRIQSGPVDAIHGDAKYCLNENRLLRQDVNYSSLQCIVMTDLPESPLSQATSVGNNSSPDAPHCVRTPDGATSPFEQPVEGKQLSSADSRATSCENLDETCETDRFIPESSTNVGVHGSVADSWPLQKRAYSTTCGLRQYNVKLLDVDTVTQAKEKILEFIYRHVGLRDRPLAANLHLFHIPDAPASTQRKLPLRDEDETNEVESNVHLRRLNTLAHYGLGASYSVTIAGTSATTKSNTKVDVMQTTSHSEGVIYLMLVADSSPYLPNSNAARLGMCPDERTPNAARSSATGKSPAKAALLHSASATPVCQEKMKQRSTVALSGTAAAQCQPNQGGRRRGTFDTQVAGVPGVHHPLPPNVAMQSNLQMAPPSYSSVILNGSNAQHSMSMTAMPTVHSQYIRMPPAQYEPTGVTLQQQAAIGGSRSSNDVSTLGRSGGNQQTETSNYKLWHLVKQAEKLPSEIFTPNLLMVKSTLQRYIDGFFAVLLNTSMPLQQNAAALLARNGTQLTTGIGSQPNGQALNGSGSGSGSCLLRSGSGSVGGLMVGSLSGLIYNGAPSATADAGNVTNGMAVAQGQTSMSSEQLPLTAMPSAAQISACIQQTLQQETAFPLAIKFMFDFFDEQAILHNIEDPSVVHTWKSNALPLRFWVNLLLNPEYLFDVPKATTPLYACLSVISQMYITACSADEHRLTKDDPSSKLLFNREIPAYKRAVEKYYQDIRQVPAISDQEMTASLLQESRENENVFYTLSAAYELLKHFVAGNREALLQALRDNEPARKIGLPRKFEQVCQLVFD